jgi:hypothetical protein
MKLSFHAFILTNTLYDQLVSPKCEPYLVTFMLAPLITINWYNTIVIKPKVATLYSNSIYMLMLN